MSHESLPWKTHLRDFCIIEIAPKKSESKNPLNMPYHPQTAKKSPLEETCTVPFFVAVTSLETEPILSGKILENSTKFCIS